MKQALDSLAASLTGTAILFEALALGSSVAQRVERLVDDYHLSPAFARQLCNGATNWVDYDLAADPRPNELPTEFLILISKGMNNLEPEERENYRDKMLTFAVDKRPSVPEMKKACTEQGRDFMPRTTKPSVTVSKQADATGLKHARIALKAQQMDEFISACNALGPDDSHQATSQRWAEGLLTLVAKWKEKSFDDVTLDHIWDRTLAPCFIIDANDMKYTGDGKFATTDGNLIDATDLANSRLAPFGFVTIYDADGNIGAHYQLENQRFATKQLRSAIACDQIFCSHPGCYRLAVYSQMHHSHAWSRGGPTNAEVIIAACKYHNGRNDDDPGKPKNGRHERDPITGEAGFIPPGSDEHLVNRSELRGRSGRGINMKQRGVYRER